MVLSVFLTIVTYRNFYASKVFLRDVVSCQFTDLSFLLAVLFILFCAFVCCFAANKLVYLLTYLLGLSSTAVHSRQCFGG